jgi:hypothetical protein
MGVIKKKYSMTDRNSTVEHQLRPDELMAELDIKKQAYYDYLKHLGIKAEKDSKGNAYLTQPQVNLIRVLRKHVVAGGKIEEFAVDEASVALAVADAGELDESAGSMPQVDPTGDLNLQALHREASKVAAHRMAAGHHLVLAMAEQMTYDDLHPESKAQVDQVREATVPKFNAQAMATELLNQFRSQRQAPDEQSQPDPSLQTA